MDDNEVLYVEAPEHPIHETIFGALAAIGVTGLLAFLLGPSVLFAFDLARRAWLGIFRSWGLL